MDYPRLGAAFRAIRLRQRLRQEDVAVAAGVSQSLVSDIENGKLGHVKAGQILSVANALGVSVQIDVRWRGGDLAKLLDARHAALVNAAVIMLRNLGWDVRPEHTFAVYGERGSIDVFAWLPSQRALLVVEVKPAITDLQDTISTHDRKRRLSAGLARALGWNPLLIGTLLVLAEGSSNRALVARHAAVLEAAYPARGREVFRWLRQPDRDLRGILFLRYIAGDDAKQQLRAVKRVRRPRSAGTAAKSRSEVARAVSDRPK